MTDTGGWSLDERYTIEISSNVAKVASHEGLHTSPDNRVRFHRSMVDHSSSRLLYIHLRRRCSVYSGLRWKQQDSSPSSQFWL